MKIQVLFLWFEASGMASPWTNLAYRVCMSWAEAGGVTFTNTSPSLAQNQIAMAKNTRAMPP